MRFLMLPLIALAIACSMAQAQPAPTQQPTPVSPGASAAVQPAERPNGQADEIQPSQALTQKPDQAAGTTPGPATGATGKPRPKAEPEVNSIVSQLAGRERDCLPESVQTDQDLMDTLLTEDETHFERAMANQQCLGEDSMIRLQMAATRREGLEPLSEESYRCVTRAAMGWEDLTPAEKKPSDEPDKAQAMQNALTMLVGAMTLMAYCSTDEEWRLNNPGKDLQEKRPQDCVVDETGGPAGFMELMAQVDDEVQQQLEQAGRNCRNRLGPPGGEAGNPERYHERQARAPVQGPDHDRVRLRPGPRRSARERSHLPDGNCRI